MTQTSDLTEQMIAEAITTWPLRSGCRIWRDAPPEWRHDIDAAAHLVRRLKFSAGQLALHLLAMWTIREAEEMR
jgi:hypothetical protein